MREIKTHHTSDFARNHIEVFAIDEPGSGGGNHEYLIRVWDRANPHERQLVAEVKLRYQHGPIKDGVNGRSGSGSVQGELKA